MDEGQTASDLSTLNSKPKPVSKSEGWGGVRRGAGPCLGRLVPQRSQAAFLGAPQHRAAAVGLCGAICHGEPEVRDAAQVWPAAIHKGKGHDEKSELSSSRNLSILGDKQLQRKRSPRSTSSTRTWQPHGAAPCQRLLLCPAGGPFLSGETDAGATDMSRWGAAVTSRKELEPSEFSRAAQEACLGHC